MTDLSRKWKELRDTYPALEIPHDREEQTAFERFVADMGYDGIIQINGYENDKNQKSNNRGK